MASTRKRIASVSIALVLTIAGTWIWNQMRPDGESTLGDSVSVTAPVVVPLEQNSEAAELDPNAHALDPVIAFARDVLESMKANVVDYTAVMIKRERVGGRVSDESRMRMKIRNRVPDGPNKKGLSVYLKFEEPKAKAGREVIWIENENENKLIAHETGFKNWTRLYLDPNGMLAMMGNRYPITEVGLSRMVEKLIEKGIEDREKGDCRVDVVDGQKIGDRPCRLIQVVHPEQDDKFDFHIAQIFIDTERNIPLRYAAFLWPDDKGQEPPLEEEYTYLNVELNVGLTDADFDPDNDNYDYP